MEAPERGFISSQPAGIWEEGLLSGNGTLGACVLSRPEDEIVIFTHERLWLPMGPPVEPPHCGPRLFEIRRLIDRGLYRQAAELAAQLSEQDGFLYPDPFVPAFDLNIRMPAEGDLADYCRAVDVRTGETIVSWADDRGAFERRLFVSRADAVAVLRITGPPGAVGATLAFRPREVDPHLDEKLRERSSARFEEFVADVATEADASGLSWWNSFPGAYPGSIHALAGIGLINSRGGNATPAGDALAVDGADEVLALIDLRPVYDPDASPAEEMRERLAALPASYSDLLARHVEIHGGLFDRVRLDLGGGEDHLLTTEELIERSDAEDPNRALIEKEFDAARYNIISCTGEWPPALQGIWGGTYCPGWAGDFTHNGNVPSAIAATCMGNMPELMLAYTGYIESIVPYLELNAERIFGARGVVLPSRSSTHGFNNAVADGFPGAFWVSGAGWAAHFFYDYYLYTGDRDFLAGHALPFMEKAALFFEDYLFEGPDGTYVFSPTQSAENTPANSNSQASFNATMAVAVAKELFTNTIAASEELGVNAERIPTWHAMLAKMPDYMIDEDGIIKEWLTLRLRDQHNHRHSSHLYALYDGMPEEIERDPGLQAAFRALIELKLDRHWKEGSGFMSFGVVQIAQAAASLHEGDLAYRCLGHLANRYWLGNLASMHNHRELLNMDISGGMPSVIIKMLVGSHPGRVQLLPALPSAWPRGTIEGILCRGRIEVKRLHWDDGTVEVELLSAIEQEVSLEMQRPIGGISGDAAIAETGTEENRRVILPAGKAVSLRIELR